jgi:hypothetical protein
MSDPLSDKIDRLFQAPLADFTAARNALAKAEPARAADIRKLEKPSTPAWAVNQVYWRHRKAYEKLVRAAERVRAANAQMLKGKRVDLAPLEIAHRVAVREASDRAHESLIASGDVATPATMKAVQDTVRALPVAGSPGRLTRPLGFVGFDSLGGLLQGAVLARGAAAAVVKFAVPDRQAAAKAARDQAREADRIRAEAAARAAERRALDAKRRKLEDRVRRTRIRIVALNRDLDAANEEIAAVNRELQTVLDALERLPH